MEIEKVFKELKEDIGINKVLKNEPMSEHTSFKVGGPADILIIPETIEDLKNIIIYVGKNNCPLFIIGNGSNLIVKDKGVRGIVLKIFNNFNNTSIKDDIIEAEAGILLSKLSNIAMKKGLAGLEFASGIPGTLGGAIVMNAGAYGGQISAVVEQTEYIDLDGNIRILEKDQHNFGYRQSYFSYNPSIILKSKLRLNNSSKEQIKSLMDKLTSQRIGKQPLSFPSAGSVFKRPEGYFAGKLIEDAGLRGYSNGGAQVSEKHTGFIINKGGATAKQIIELIHIVQYQVKSKFGVDLETEVKIIGEE